jgi:hypothetical protein
MLKRLSESIEGGNILLRHRQNAIPPSQIAAKKMHESLIVIHILVIARGPAISPLPVVTFAEPMREGAWRSRDLVAPLKKITYEPLSGLSPQVILKTR